MNEVANGIAERDVELARDPARHRLGLRAQPRIPRSSSDAVDVALNGATREIDLGRVHYRAWAGADETRWFANVASAGMSGAIAQRANDTTKALGGKVSYLLATLDRVRALAGRRRSTSSVDEAERDGPDARRHRRQRAATSAAG